VRRTYSSFDGGQQQLHQLEDASDDCGPTRVQQIIASAVVLFLGHSGVQPDEHHEIGQSDGHTEIDSMLIVSYPSRLFATKNKWQECQLKIHVPYYRYHTGV
jgi:hypothetical protein